jgi:predicted amidohydrolase YtcJ
MSHCSALAKAVLVIAKLPVEGFWYERSRRLLQRGAGLILYVNQRRFKMSRILIALSVALLLGACQPAAEKAVPTLAVRCGDVIDGLSDDRLGSKLIVIRNERFAALLDADADPPQGARVLNLSDYTCLPGLIDTHTHIALNHDDSGDMTIYYRRPMSETMAITRRNAKVTLEAGFTTIRNVGDYFPDALLQARELINEGAMPGPRIQTAGSYLTIPGGGGDLMIPGHDVREIPPGTRIGVARGPDEFADATRRVLANGADMIKIIASGAVFAFGGIPGEPEMTREEIEAVVAVAHAAGVKVTAHAHGAQSIKDAILAGVDSIEHASLADDEAIALAAERGVAFSMDVYNGTFTAEVGEKLGYPEEFMRKNDETTEAQRVVFEKAYAAGIPILYGTDSGVLQHGLNGKQFAIMVRRGMKPMDAIRSATSVAATHMDMAADVGAIEVGRYGDLVAVKGDPLADISTLEDVTHVIKGGKIVKQPVTGSQTAADSVYHSGKIYTVDAKRPWAEAVAIRNGKIVFVGSDDGARAFIGPKTSVHNLKGRLMLPGFQDAHIHPIYGALEVLACNLEGEASVAAYRQKIATCIANQPDKEWIIGGGWLMPAFGPGAKASKTILDELDAERPIYMRSADGHSGWANSRALEIAGITRDTPDPEDGFIDRDPETGEAIGSLQEGAMDLVEEHIPSPGPDERRRALEYIRDMLHAYGITSVQEAYAYEQDLVAYEALDKQGRLNLRLITAMLWDNKKDASQLDDFIRLRERYSSGYIRPTSAKIFVDGVMENYTAVMLEPYLVESGTSGIPMMDPEYMTNIVTRLDKAGFQVHFHALGDGAVRLALDAVEQARLENGPSDHRHHLSHLQVIHPDDMPRFAELGAIANFQPAWAYADEYVVDLTLPFIKPEVAKWMYPIRSVIDAGATVAFGSDWNVSTADPFYQIETAVTRVDALAHDTPPLNPEQAITVAEAIEAFTINAAYVNHQEDTTGSIEVGKFADLVVLSKNLLEIEPQAISDTKVLLTLFAGKPVHGEPTDL